MSKLKVVLPFAIILVLALSACSGGSSNQNNTQGTGLPGLSGTGVPSTIPNTGGTSVAAPTIGGGTTYGTSVSSTPVSGGGLSTSVAMPTEATTTGVVSTPVVAGTTTTGTTSPTSVVVSQPTAIGTQSGVAVTGNGQLVKLSSMLNYRVVDSTGAELGKVTDYVINQCEAHLLYLVVTLTGSTSGTASPASTGTATTGTAAPAATGASTGTTGSSNSILIPYEAFTVNQPSKVSQDTFVLATNVPNLSSAPSIDVTNIDLENPTWETNVLTFWRQYTNLTLTAGCRVPAPGAVGTPSFSGTVMPGTTGTVVPSTSGLQTSSTTTVAGSSTQTSGSSTVIAGTPVSPFPTRTSNRVNVYRLALATQMLKAQLMDGTGAVLGQVNDVMVAPTTGAILYVVIQPTSTSNQAGGGVMSTQPAGGVVTGTPTSSSQTTQNMIALPDGAFTVRYIAGNTSQKQLVLILLVQNSVFSSAPAYLPGTNTVDPKWFDYWNQYIPMTMSELP